jgi:hypothetical protein
VLLDEQHHTPEQGLAVEKDNRLAGVEMDAFVEQDVVAQRRGSIPLGIVRSAAGFDTASTCDMTDPAERMGILTTDMKRVVDEQRLGFVATICPDGTPNLSPKGTTPVWDDDHLVFANIRSPGTLANLRQNASVEVRLQRRGSPRRAGP